VLDLIVRVDELKDDGGGGQNDKLSTVVVVEGVFGTAEVLFMMWELNSGEETLPSSRGEREGASTIRSWTKPDRRRLFPTRGNRPQ
jgi:hypothetical protein